jgi:hypothetical protein
MPTPTLRANQLRRGWCLGLPRAPAAAEIAPTPSFRPVPVPVPVPVVTEGTIREQLEQLGRLQLRRSCFSGAQATRERAARTMVPDPRASGYPPRCRRRLRRRIRKIILRARRSQPQPQPQSQSQSQSQPQPQPQSTTASNWARCLTRQGYSHCTSRLSMAQLQTFGSAAGCTEPAMQISWTARAIWRLSRGSGCRWHRLVLELGLRVSRI